MQCGAELSVFRDRVSALAWQDIGTGGFDGAATVMASRPSLATPGVTVDIVGVAHWHAPSGTAAIGISVAMLLGSDRGGLDGGDSDRAAAGVYWEEAHAWAGAVAGGQWAAAEFTGSQEAPGGVIFQYLLKAHEASYAIDHFQGAL
ncbi:hypothetical protein [Arthrobacter sp. ISL-28]|uniref:hypothetical protein n=1 Tax=Arthrobacter sp. ISL-28 TaxID=2819108 RepID=UPI001BE89CF5|nr:hypothetical protein [Arthrobacter sp. ISL-28]MBT2521917.1 hypothetical protein [Arthrobacter sp. ISL-28]